MAGLYVHVPFRRARRPYDEAYYVAADGPEVEAFVRAVLSELHQLDEGPTGGMSVETLYIGGGRPGLLPPESLRSMLDGVRSAFGDTSLDEATIELTPTDVTQERLGALCKAGITRVSLEALSFVDEDLDALGAPHSAEKIHHAVEGLKTGSLASFSLDLAFGHARQRLAHWKSSLHRAVELDIPHVTIYDVRRSAEDDDADTAEHLAFAMTFLKAKGYRQYELTHFARPRHTSRHQRNYYTHGDYLGVGPSAESFWWPDRSEPATARRWSNVDDIGAYVDRIQRGESPADGCHELDRTTLAWEYLLLCLRTGEGLDLTVLASRYGVDLHSQHASFLDRLAREDLIRLKGNVLLLSDRGRLVTDAIAKRLLPT